MRKFIQLTAQIKRLWKWLCYQVRTAMSHTLAAIIPNHGKRILFNTSVYFELSRETYPSSKVLKRLNAALRLAVNDDALELPAHLHALFWQNRLDEILHKIPIQDLIERQDPEQIEMFCSILVNATPRWMKYGRRTDMIQDVKRILVKTREDYLNKESSPQTA